jgi:transposase
MLNPSSGSKIYLFTGYTDMRKGASSLAMLVGSMLTIDPDSSKIFVFRGRSADKIKILWWDQGFCLFYKCFDKGKFIWPVVNDKGTIGITRAQLSMLLEGIDWRLPKWSQPPEYVG